MATGDGHFFLGHGLQESGDVRCSLTLPVQDSLPYAMLPSQTPEEGNTGQLVAVAAHN